MDPEIDAIEYASKRAEEILGIEREIAQDRKKNKMLFQRIPFHKRRRSAAFDERRLPKDARRGERNRKSRVKQRVLHSEDRIQAHTWYAKRFIMEKSLGIPIPYRMCCKSDGFARAAVKTRGLLYDISYLQLYLYDVPADGTMSMCCVRYTDMGERIIEYKREGGEEKVIIKEKDVNEKEVKNILKNISMFYIVGKQSLYRGSGYFNCHSLREIEKRDKKDKKDKKEKSEYKDIPYLSVELGNERVLLVLSRADCMQVMEKCAVQGIVPCGVYEMYRVCTERMCAFYPFDFLSTKRGLEMHNQMQEKEREKRERTPVGKRAPIIGSLYSGDVSSTRPYLFTCQKGSFTAGSPVIIRHTEERVIEMSASDEVVGFVSRSSYCYAKGRTAGVMQIDRRVNVEEVEEGARIYIRNVRGTLFRQVEMYPVVEKNIL